MERSFSVMVNASQHVMIPGNKRLQFWMSKDVFLKMDFSMIKQIKLQMVERKIVCLDVKDVLLLIGVMNVLQKNGN